MGSELKVGHGEKDIFIVNGWARLAWVNIGKLVWAKEG